MISKWKLLSLAFIILASTRFPTDLSQAFTGGVIIQFLISTCYYRLSNDFLWELGQWIYSFRSSFVNKTSGTAKVESKMEQEQQYRDLLKELLQEHIFDDLNGSDLKKVACLRHIISEFKASLRRTRGQKMKILNRRQSAKQFSKFTCRKPKSRPRYRRIYRKRQPVIDCTENLPDVYFKLIKFLKIDETKLNEQRLALQKHRTLMRKMREKCSIYEGVQELERIYDNTKRITAIRKALENQNLFIKILQAENDILNGIFTSDAINSARLSETSWNTQSLSPISSRFDYFVEAGSTKSAEVGSIRSDLSSNEVLQILDTLDFNNSNFKTGSQNSTSDFSKDTKLSKREILEKCFPSFYNTSSRCSITTNCYDQVEIEEMLAMIYDKNPVNSLHPNPSSCNVVKKSSSKVITIHPAASTETPIGYYTKLKSFVDSKFPKSEKKHKRTKTLKKRRSKGSIDLKSQSKENLVKSCEKSGKNRTIGKQRRVNSLLKKSCMNSKLGEKNEPEGKTSTDSSILETRIQPIFKFTGGKIGFKEEETDLRLHLQSCMDLAAKIVAQHQSQLEETPLRRPETPSNCQYSFGQDFFSSKENKNSTPSSSLEQFSHLEHQIQDTLESHTSSDQKDSRNVTTLEIKSSRTTGTNVHTKKCTTTSTLLPTATFTKPTVHPFKIIRSKSVERFPTNQPYVPKVEPTKQEFRRVPIKRRQSSSHEPRPSDPYEYDQIAKRSKSCENSGKSFIPLPKTELKSVRKARIEMYNKNYKLPPKVPEHQRKSQMVRRHIGSLGRGKFAEPTINLVKDCIVNRSIQSLITEEKIETITEQNRSVIVKKTLISTEIHEFNNRPLLSRLEKQTDLRNNCKGIPLNIDLAYDLLNHLRLRL